FHAPSTFLGYTDVTSFLQAWLPIVFMGALVVGVFVLMKHIPRTRPTEIKPDSAPSIGWPDIAGADEAKEELREVVEYLRRPGRPAPRSLRPPDLRLAPRRGRARTHPPRPLAQQAAGRRRRPQAAGPPDLGPDRRRPRQHLQRGRDLRRPPRRGPGRDARFR